MNDPHDKYKYVKTDVPDVPQSGEDTTTAPEADGRPETENRRVKPPKFSGAYYYVDTEEKKLRETAFIRTMLTTLAILLQVVVLMLPQGGLEYVTKNISSYAFVYMMLIFVMLGISIWLIIMNMTRYKLIKRIPKEYAPKHGFEKRAFFGNELFIGANAVITVMELSFVCIHYDAVGLVAFFLCVLATAAAVWARQIVHNTLKTAELIPPPSARADESAQNDSQAEGSYNNDNK